MNREIKFRVWNTQNNKWEYYNFLHFLNFSVPIDIRKICEYTGLKDQNDVEIYEGDILQIYDDDDKPSIKVYVSWNKDKACYKVSQLDNKLCVDINNVMINRILKSRVLGNIYENKELIGR